MYRNISNIKRLYSKTADTIFDKTDTETMAMLEVYKSLSDYVGDGAGAIKHLKEYRDGLKKQYPRHRIGVEYLDRFIENNENNYMLYEEVV